MKNIHVYDSYAVCLYCYVHMLVSMVKDAFQKCHRGLSTSEGPAASMSANPLSPPYISSVGGSDNLLGLRCFNEWGN